MEKKQKRKPTKTPAMPGRHQVALSTPQLEQLVLLFDPSAQMKIGCDNSVVRLVSSGNYINRVSFQYQLLEHQDLLSTRENSLDNFCTVE